MNVKMFAFTPTKELISFKFFQVMMAQIFLLNKICFSFPTFLLFSFFCHFFLLLLRAYILRRKEGRRLLCVGCYYFLLGRISKGDYKNTKNIALIKTFWFASSLAILTIYHGLSFLFRNLLWVNPLSLLVHLNREMLFLSFGIWFNILNISSVTIEKTNFLLLDR